MNNIIKKYDVVVAGGGLSGVAAAMSAARHNLKVLLVEKFNCLGGAAVTSLVNPFMPYWLRGDEKKGRVYINNGIFKELLDNLKEMDALCSDEMVFNEEYLKLILNRLVLKEKVDILFNSYLYDAYKEEGVIKYVKIATKSGNLKIEADYFVDCTGDADLAAICDVPFQLGRENDSLCQPMTLCFRIANVQFKKDEIINKANVSIDYNNINKLYKELKLKGEIKNPRENVLIFHNMVNGVLHLNSTRVVGKNPVDAFELTEAEIEAREQAFELYNFLKNNIDGFENSQFLTTASQIGIRESRMIKGKYVLTKEDLVSGRKFEDGIAACSYEMDIHNPDGEGTTFYSVPKGDYYTIPYRCLQPIGIDNLLVAGRCISSTHEAQSSFRIMPVCCCLGEAAGTAVGIISKSKATVGDVDIDLLKRTLKSNGAVL